MGDMARGSHAGVSRGREKSEYLSPALAEEVLRRALRRGGEFAEVFAESSERLTLGLDDGRVEDLNSGDDIGASIRIVRGATTVFGYCESLEPEAVLTLADELSGRLKDEAAGGRRLPAAVLAQAAPPAPAEVDPAGVGVSVKADLLRGLDATARGRSPEVRQASVAYNDERRRVWVANSRGVFAEENRTRVFLAVSVVAQRGDVFQTGRETLARRAGYEAFDSVAVHELAQCAADKALIMLDAKPAPAGKMPVVLANGFGGVLFHEACGHGLEADFILKKTSVWTDKMGERVAEPFVTALDDGLGAGMWGTNAIDDEGTPTAVTPVIENGVLTAYLTDVLRGERLGYASTGNSRRQSFRHIPYPRMTNTYFAPGEGSAEALVADTPRAFYAKSLSGGQVDPATGDFVFGVSEGYLIENGRVGPPVRGATLIGNGLDVLRAIDAIASDLVVKAGMCGKEGQLVPVGTGQPTLRIRELTVGGTSIV